VNDTEGLWILCSEALREQVSDAIWQAYLSGITPVSIEDGEIVLGVPNTLIRDRVESRFLGLIQDTVTGTVGRDLVVQLEVVAPVYEPTDERVTVAVAEDGRDAFPDVVHQSVLARCPSHQALRAAIRDSASTRRCSIRATPSTPS
jgi:chromosomal replication initiation ATPase DnaA